MRGQRWANGNLKMVTTSRILDRLDPAIEKEATTLSGIHDALAWKHISELAADKRQSLRTIIYPTEPAGLESSHGGRKLQSRLAFSTLAALSSDLQGNGHMGRQPPADPHWGRRQRTTPAGSIRGARSAEERGAPSSNRRKIAQNCQALAKDQGMRNWPECTQPNVNQ
jgi:hypothetical protein